MQILSARRVAAPLGGVVVLTASATALAASTPPAGSVHQAFGKAGCYTDGGASETGPHTCRNVRGARGATTVAISPDGRFAYIDGYGGNKTTAPPALAVLKRNPKTGALSQLAGKSGCFSGDGSSTAGPNTCTKARDLGSGDATSVVISSDGRFLYVASQNTTSSTPVGGVAIFKRNAETGKLSQLNGANGCITTDGTTSQSGTNKLCEAMPNISEPWDVATPDNQFVYVPASYGPRLVQVFKRNAQGGLVPLKGKGGCISDTGTSPAGICAKGHGLYNPERAVPSSNGKFLYVASFQAPSPIVVLNRNPKTGLLRERSGPTACISVDGTTGDKVGSCRTGTNLEGEYAGALSPNGRTLYFSEDGIGSTTDSGLTIFRVSPTRAASRSSPGSTAA